MPKYKCLNKNCKSYNKVEWSNSVTRVVKGELVDSGIPCPECFENRELVVEEGMTTYMSGSDNICKR